MTTKLEIEMEYLVNRMTEPDEKQIAQRLYNEAVISLRAKKRRKMIIEALKEKTYDTLKEISSHTGIPYGSVRNIINTLVRQKIVVESIYKTPHLKGRSQRLFSLPE